MRRPRLHILGAAGVLLLPLGLPASAADTTTLTAPGGAYRVTVNTDKLGLQLRRGGENVLRTTEFRAGAATVGRVSSVRSTRDRITATAKASDGSDVTMSVTLRPDRFELAWSTPTRQQRTVRYDLASAGHWYGGGETSEGKKQPYPLSAGEVDEPEFSPASYMMQEPYFTTSKSVGIYLPTQHPMKVAFNHAQSKTADLTVTGDETYRSTIFVERSRKAVYDDYLGVVGKAQRSQAKLSDYDKPVWNSWAQFYRNIDQRKILDWARSLQENGLDGHTIQLDDKWESAYGNLTFDAKTFPEPRKMSDAIHAMGQKFGLWTTFWINLDSANYSYARDHGYLLRAKDSTQPCQVTWWNGTAGIIDLANADARRWYVDNLHGLMQKYGVDGFKFDTRFFDDRCAPSNGMTPQDYQRLGADMTKDFDQQGVGIRAHWGSQKYGFVTRAVDADTTFDGLRVSLRRSMAISTNGYPFVETDMIGGSNSMPPPSKEVLLRWAQAASVMPLMYGSTSPLDTIDTTTGKPVHYDAETARLYRASIDTHRKLAPYLHEQVRHAVATGAPIMRPVFFDRPNDHRFDTVDDEWFLGPALLAAPMIDAGTRRDIVLPQGVWFDVNTHRVVLGGTTLRNYSAPLSVTPMFVDLLSPATHRYNLTALAAR